MQIKKQLKDECLNHEIKITKAGLVAVFVSARCKSKKQINSNVDEDLRVEINSARFREIPPRKYIQLFNIPPAFNGSKLKRLKKTVVFLTVLTKGKHIISLIPKNSAFVEEIKVKELSGMQKVKFDINEQAEDGDRRPWYAFVLLDLPLANIKAEATIKYRLSDSDDIKLLIDNKAQKQSKSVLHRFWIWAGSSLKKVLKQEASKEYFFETNLPQATHYIEFYADKTPALSFIYFNLSYTETKAEIRAENIIKDNTYLIKQAAREFSVDSIIIGAVIYQEQSTNVNFVDTLGDYIGGLLHLNTSIGVGQVRVNTAEALERIYPKLDPYRKDSIFIDYNVVRVERLKDVLTNIMYVAAKLKFSQDRWAEAGFDISNKPDILGTLYNIEDIDKPITPTKNPKPNDFGIGVKQNYDKVEKLLGL